MKKIQMIIIMALALISLASCGKNDKPPAHRHTPVKVDAKAATCTQTGNGEYYSCSGCLKVFVDKNCELEARKEELTVEMAEHTWTAADCKTPKTCALCNKTEGEALGHDYDESEWGHTDESGHARLCSVCGEKGEVSAHTPGEGPTEESAQLCSDCGYELAPKLGHKHDFTEVTYEWSADFKECTATRICKKDTDHVETETVSSVYSKEDSTCTSAGREVYLAVFENPDFQAQMKVFPIRTADHTDANKDNICDSCSAPVSK